MTVPPDILIILLILAVILVLAFFMDKHIHKEEIEFAVKRHPTPKVTFHKERKNQDD